MILLRSVSAFAQEAPVGQASGGGDGFGGAGGIPTAVPFVFPTERHGMPVPVSVTTRTGALVAEAGAGFGLDLNFISQNTTLSRRRPRSLTFASPPTVDTTNPRTVLHLFGRTIQLVRVSTGGQTPRYQGITDAKLEAVLNPNNTFDVTDGSGFRYRFLTVFGMQNDRRWYLAQITSGHGSNSKLELGYVVTPRMVGSVNAPELTLHQVRYNYDASGTCAKNVIDLVWQSADTSQSMVALNIEEGALRSRTQLLQRIDIGARSTTCSAPQVLARYHFRYAPDADSQTPRLVAVDTSGRDGTPEATLLHPVVRYVYGSAGVQPAPQLAPELRYLETDALALPGFATALGSVSRSFNGGYDTDLTLADFDGDALPDVVGKTSWSRNIGGVSFSAAQPTFTPLTVPPTYLSFETMGASIHHYGNYATGVTRYEDSKVRAIDFNGDGRMDIVDANQAGQPGTWVWRVYLNEPTGWRQVLVDMSDVGKTLALAGHDLGVTAGVLPVMRRATGANAKAYQCIAPIGPMGQYVTCPNTKMAVDVGTQESRIEWDLRDVNGDGYPDLVTTKRPSRQRLLAASENQAACRNVTTGTGSGSPVQIADLLPHAHPGEVICNDEWRFEESELVVGTDGKSTWVTSPAHELQVFYNRAGVTFVSESQGLTPSAFTQWVPLPGNKGCSVERWVSSPIHVSLEAAIQSAPNSNVISFGALGSARSTQTCGLVDLTGDGIPDRVSNGSVLVGTGTGFSLDVSARYDASLTETETDFWAVCEAPKYTGMPYDANALATKKYESRTVSGYIDVNGDGLVDKWLRTQIRLGARLGLARPLGRHDGQASLAINRSVSDCAGNSIKTTAGLFDVNGDGSPDYVVQDGRTLRVYSLTDAEGLRGALGSSRIVSTENGYGAVTKIRYGSLKADTSTKHHVPFAEIQPIEVSLASRGGVGSPSAPIYMAYGGARLWYDSASDQWLFPGYERRVTLTGLQNGWSPFVSGEATIADAVPLPADNFVTPWALSVLSGGRPRSTYKLGGVFLADPRALLTSNPASDSRWRAQVDYTYDVQLHPLDGFAPQSECLTRWQPYGDFQFLIPYNGAVDPVCREQALVWAKSETSRQGIGAPIADAFTESRTDVDAIDDLGRPTLIHHYRDTMKITDDLCELRDYALFAADSPWRVAHAVKAVQFAAPKYLGEFTPGSCSTVSAILADGYSLYDGAPYGTVTAGLQTETIRSRRDPNGAVMDQWSSQRATYDAVGNLVIAETRTGDDTTVATIASDWDPFALIARSTTIQASDGSPALTGKLEIDPYTLFASAKTDAYGVKLRTTRDGFGRTKLTTWEDPVTHNEYIASSLEYLGETSVSGNAPIDASMRNDDVFDPLGRRAMRKSFKEAVELADANLTGAEPTATETWSQVWVDFVGRETKTEQWLGEDYAGAHTIRGETTFDGLGRPAFVADMYEAGTPGVRYGTSFVYNDDTTLRCQVRGRGPQSLTSISTLEARYPSCVTVQYALNRKYTQSWGASELDPTSSLFGAYSDVVSDAVGNIESKWRRGSDGSAIERIQYDYDLLGRVNAVTRYADPTLNVASTLWATTHDSLGQVLSFSEPAAAVRHYKYDRGGHQLESFWHDGANTWGVRSAFDAFGRLLRTVELNNDDELPESANTFHYDSVSAQPFHANARYTRGRLTYAESAFQSVYFGYDALGHESYVAWLDSAGRRVERSTEFRPDGAVSQLTYKLPDTDYQPEIATYEYDSAQRLERVSWQDSVENDAELYRVASYDTLGRVRLAFYGNGVVEQDVYRDADRNELQTSLLHALNGTRTASYTADASLRVSSVNERTTVGGTRNRLDQFRYDAAGRLASVLGKVPETQAVVKNDIYMYDGLGNLLTLVDLVGNRSFVATPDVVDPDRLCRVTMPGDRTKGCNFAHDVLGNVTMSPLTATTMRVHTYDLRARMTDMSTNSGGIGSQRAAWRYGPMGDPASLTIVGSLASDTRDDVLYGDVASRTLRLANGAASYVYERNIPLGNSASLSRSGSGKGSTKYYSHADKNGLRAVTDGNGNVIQELEYHAFGEVARDTGTPGDVSYRSDQYNGGDMLRDFRVNKVGARAYDPRFGRFLSRDPVVEMRSAQKAHPYGFAWNDPINLNDPSGLQVEIRTDTSNVSNGARAMGFAGAFWGIFWGSFVSTTGNLWSWDPREGAYMQRGGAETIQIVDRAPGGPTAGVTLGIATRDKDIPAMVKALRETPETGHIVVKYLNELNGKSDLHKIPGFGEAWYTTQIYNEVIQAEKDFGSVDTIYIIGHGSAGDQHLMSWDPNYQAHFSEGMAAALRGHVNHIILGGCHIAQGDTGEEYLQRLADLSGATVTARTGYNAPGVMRGNGLQITRKPGQPFSRGESLARQMLALMDGKMAVQFETAPYAETVGAFMSHLQVRLMGLPPDEKAKAAAILKGRYKIPEGRD